MQPDDAGSKLPGTQQEVGRWNHPAKMDTLGHLVAVAMQDVNLKSDWGECGGKTGEKDKVVWFSFANPDQPQRMATWTGPQMHLPGGNSPDIVRVAALSVPVRGAPDSRAVLISVSGGKGKSFGIAINPEDPTRVDAYRWYGSGEAQNIARVTEWYYGHRFGGADLRVVEVHDMNNREFKHTALRFIDRDGSTHELPGPNTVSFRRGTGTRTVQTFESDRPTADRANGIFVGENGRASLLGGKVNNNERAHVWIRQRKSPGPPSAGVTSRPGIGYDRRHAPNSTARPAARAVRSPARRVHRRRARHRRDHPLGRRLHRLRRRLLRPPGARGHVLGGRPPRPHPARRHHRQPL